MAIAGVMIVPLNGTTEQEIITRLAAISGVDRCEPGPDGIAVVIEATNTKKLRQISEKIQAMDEVIDLQLAYLNWENDVDEREWSL